MMHQMVVCSLVILFIKTSTSLAKPAPCLVSRYDTLSSLVYAFDITTMDFFAEMNHTRQHWKPKNSTEPLFDYTCTNTSHVWVITSEKPPKQVQLPDQIAEVQPNTDRRIITTAPTHTSLYYYGQDLQKDIGGGLEDDGIMSLSERYRLGQKQLLSGQAIARVYGSRLFFRIKLVDAKHLLCSEKFLKMVEELSGQAPYEVNPVPYEKLVETFGTHYFAELRFGHYWLLQIALDGDYYYEKGAAKIQDIASRIYSSKFYEKPFSLPSSFAAIHPDIAFGDYGNPDHPWMIGAVKERPISVLIGDDTVEEQVQKAIGAKMAKAYLRELKYSLQLIASNTRISWIFMGKFDLTKQLAKVEQLLGKTVPPFEELNAVKGQMEKIVALATEALVVEK